MTTGAHENTNFRQSGSINVFVRKCQQILHLEPTYQRSQPPTSHYKSEGCAAVNTSFGSILPRPKSSLFFINKPGKLTGSEIKLYFDFNEQTTIRCGRGREAWCYATENRCFGAGRIAGRQPGSHLRTVSTPGRPQCRMNYPYYACWTAVSFHGFGPTGRVKVQYSLNSIGSELLPEITAPLFASTV